MLSARRFRKSLLFLTKMLLLGILVFLMIFVWWSIYREDNSVREQLPTATYYNLGGNVLVAAFYGGLLIFFCSLYGATKIGVFRLGEVIYSFVLSIVVTDILAYIVFCLVARAILQPWWIIGVTVSQILVAAAGSWCINKLYFRFYPPREMVVIYSNREEARRMIQKMMRKEERYRVCVALKDTEDKQLIYEEINRHGAVTLCHVDASLEEELYSYCNRAGKRIYLLPTLKDLCVRASNQTQLFDTPLFYSKNSGPSTEQMMIKRGIDIFFAAVFLVLFSPIMFGVSIWIKCYDGGPVIYKQQRYTRGREVFWLYKFRSMKVDAEKNSGARLSSKNDDRITPPGKIIRKLRLDEFPQLINILKGDMSLVGPRPERPEIAQEFEKTLPDFALRLQMKAGLTGYAQVYGNYNSNLSDKLLMDMIYIENYSLLMDFNLLFMTLKVIFMPERSEGLEEGFVLPEDMSSSQDTKEK